MSKKLKQSRFQCFAGEKITFRVLSQKSHQRLTLSRTMDEHFVFYPFFCTTKFDIGTSAHIVFDAALAEVYLAFDAALEEIGVLHIFGLG